MPVVAKAAAYGYTLTVSPASFLTTNKSIFKVLPYDPEADFAPVSRLPQCTSLGRLLEVRQIVRKIG